jgi:hypothetical protein
VEAVNATTPPRTLKALAAMCPAELIGTAWDPVMADCSPVASRAAQRTRMPIRVASFEC